MYVQGTDSSTTLLLLHGTGGNENDLLPLAKIIAPNASVLAVRGNVLENGMPRFFKRLSPGVFDQQDLILRTQELKEFLNFASVKYGFGSNSLVAVGYSNGANIAASLLLSCKGVLKAAILHHPMVPIRDIAPPNLAKVPIFIGAGTNDSICPPQQAEELESMFTNAGADVYVHWENNGHNLTNSEVVAAKAWFDARNWAV